MPAIHCGTRFLILDRKTDERGQALAIYLCAEFDVGMRWVNSVCLACLAVGSSLAQETDRTILLS